MSVEYRVGDVFDRLAEIPAGSIDLVVSSPPFLALRSYLPADHPDKAKEIGSEPNPAEFIDTLLALSAEFDRVLAPHGSICIELGDTFSGVGGSSSSANPAYGEARSLERKQGDPVNCTGWRTAEQLRSWPMSKSLTGIPTLYTWSLAYGRNLLTGMESPAGQWRIRNVIVWARPNPPVGALGDKFRPATSYITVACKSARRYFDLDGVRIPNSPNTHARTAAGVDRRQTTGKAADDEARSGNWSTLDTLHSIDGAPPLDWLAEDHPEDGDWLWKLSTQPYAGSHYATFPLTLPKRLIEAMCPQKVCTTCGKPAERITERSPEYASARQKIGDFKAGHDSATGLNGTKQYIEDHLGSPATGRRHIEVAENIHTGWTDCGHDTWRTGVVLDPFAGSGTTIEAAQMVGRHAIGIDIDDRNAHLAQQRVGMFLEVVQ